MDLSKSASALGLYKYNCVRPEGDLFSHFYSTILSQLGSCGVSPTYIGAGGIGYSGKLEKFGGRIHSKLVNSRFFNVNLISVAANPTGSEEPAYDGYANASLSYVDANNELLMCIVINESFVKIHSLEFQNLIHSQIKIHEFDFGYGFSSEIEKRPDFHILGLDNGKLSSDEYESLCKWYDATGEVRTTVLRDVYPYNILNEKQLDAQLSDGITLRQFAQRRPGSSLVRLTDYGLHLWRVPDAEVTKLRMLLFGSSILLSR